MESLSSLANTNCFYILQEKLNNWKYEFEHNCIEANISRCCELLELNARIQTQLFKLLGFCGIYGGLEGSEKKLKNQLLPYLGKDYFDNGLTSNVVIDILNDVGKQTKQYPLNTKNCKTPNSKNNTSPDERNFKQGIYDRLDELENIIMDLSSDSKVSYTKPVKKKKKHSLKRSTSLPKFTNDFNEISKSDAIVQLEPPGDFSGSDVEEIRNDTYLQGLVGRYNDLFSESRINAMDHLRQYNDDHENNQRILFALVMISARSVAEFQRSYRNGLRIKDRNEQIQQFRENISRSALKNLRTKIIYELINNRGNYFRFHVPQNLSFIELEGLINNTIHLFWNFGGAKNGLELMEASDGEMFDEHKYRRSYDSDFTAPLVSHHIWPCLMQNRRVLVKGEACTRSSNKMICSVQLRNRNVCSANNSISSLCSSK